MVQKQQLLRSKEERESKIIIIILPALDFCPFLFLYLH